MSGKAATRLSRLHAYPAMVEDSFALELAQQHVEAGSRVLDPFCGSGRLLLAGACEPGYFVGVDVNPLACLIARAKATPADLDIVREMLRELGTARVKSDCQDIHWKEERKVRWYTEAVKEELGEIIGWINSLALAEPDKVVAAVALSNAARDASFCRNGRWKLHRMTERQRSEHSCSAWDVFGRVLRYYAETAAGEPAVSGVVEIVCGQAQSVLRDQGGGALPAEVDLILTSPPYGDSKSTVQYGAASSLCLDVVSQLTGFESLYVSGAEIDARCLGGKGNARGEIGRLRDISRYWAGSRHNKGAERVVRFLMDFQEVLDTMKSMLAPGGKMVLVLGRRSVGGFRVKLDAFAADWLEPERI